LDDEAARGTEGTAHHPAIHAATHSADAMFLIEEDGTIVWANAAAHGLLGSPDGTLPTQNLYLRLSGAELELALQGLALVELGIPTRPAVYHPTCDDGTTRPAEVIATRAVGAPGRLVVSARPADHAQWVIDEFVRLVSDGPTDAVIDRALAEIVVPWPGHVASVLVRDPTERGFGRVIGHLSPQEADAVRAVPEGPWHTALSSGETTTASIEELSTTVALSALSGYRRCFAVPLPLEAPQACLVLWERHGAAVEMSTFWQRAPALMILSSALRQEELLRELRLAASTDRLTGLRNRAGLEEAMLAVEAPTVGVLAIDLDGFKEINDTHGHRAGDDVLVEIAARLAAAVRTTDVTARVGGDEMLALCEGATMSELATIADRFLTSMEDPIAVRANHPPGPGRVELLVSASVGLGLGDRTDLDNLLGAVDVALYRAKRDGGARWSATGDHPPDDEGRIAGT
jgi:diguanylate cyclase (GGDEF)-like protein